MRREIAFFSLILALAPAACRSADPPPADNACGGQVTTTSQPTTAPSTQPFNPARWCVTGEISDASGHPLEAVEVTAHCGAGSLRGTGRTVSGPDGKYVLWFAQGMISLNDSTGLQAATIAPHKTGMVERNLHRQGDLLMAKRPPAESDVKSWGKDKRVVVFPDTPLRVDFVMVPAATISGRLTDAHGQPIANHYVSVGADELPPSSSVLATMKTDDAGRFRFTEIPAGSVWLLTRTPEDVLHEVRTERLECSAEHVYDVTLTYAPGPPPRVTLQRTVTP